MPGPRGRLAAAAADLDDVEVSTGLPRSTKRRWPVVAASVAAVVGTITAAVLTASSGDGRGGSSPETVLDAAGTAAPGPTGTGTRTGATGRAAALPATGVTIRDEQRSVTITWQDPSDGQAVPRLVVSRGEQALFVGDLPAGIDHYRLDGLSPDLNLCVTVTLVYGENTAPASAPVCTRRDAP